METNKQNALIKRDDDQLIKYPGPERLNVSPAADLFETSDEFVLKLDLPGAIKESIRLVAEQNKLIIQASTGYHDGHEPGFLFTEIGSKDYVRVFRLGNGIDNHLISAGYKDGVLTVTLPKNEKSRAREIKIK
jgi:HSP20 family protein